MRKGLVRIQPVSATSVKRGDVVSIDGSLHEVRDMYALPGNRKQLHFTDGETYVLGPIASTFAHRPTPEQ